MSTRAKGWGGVSRRQSVKERGELSVDYIKVRGEKKVDEREERETVRFSLTRSTPALCHCPLVAA